ncbi:PspC domain-containing protein [Marinicellulosiphila megalodicopiae]|uniref:PspC domain-containing protein n=1 Tax=Marinicellulosiphila megalodicopiae TaxID=2724896 RepID=UPI003BAFBDF2
MHHRHKRTHHENKCNNFKNANDIKREYSQHKKNSMSGYGINLYRNKKNKIIAGVCSGIGDHFGIDHSVMRVLFVIALFFTGFFPAVCGYILACMLISPRPQEDDTPYDVKVEYDESIRDYRPKTVFSKKESSKVRIDRTRLRIKKAKRRIEEMERYVTSNKFKMEQEFSNLEK